MRTRRTTSGLAVLAMGVAMAVMPAAANQPMSGDEIHDRISGKRIYLSIPLGGEFPLFYQANGTVDGSGEAVGLGKFMSPKDSGRWWVDNNRLCQKWQSWYDGRQFCFTLVGDGPEELRWTRDDGLAGRARIGN